MTSTTDQRPDHLVDLPDGRRLAFDEHGAANGPTVVFLHAAPGSRRFDPSPAVTEKAGIRLVTVDRPGYGASSPLASGVVPTVAGVAADLATGLDALGLDDYALAGWSAGGRFAAALAAHRPARVRALAVVGTPAPDDQVPWVPEQYRQMAVAMRADPAGARATIESQMSGLVGNGASAAGEVAVGPADEATLAADPDLAARLIAMLEEGLRMSVSGLAADIVADQVAPWGFDPAAIGAPTTLFYGDADEVAGPAHGQWWADAIPDADLRVAPGAGHLLAATRWADILAAVSG